MRSRLRFIGRWLLILPFTLVACTASHAADSHPKPLIRAHSHNDYEHKRPLMDALEVGFCSIEADIYLVDGKLLVAHDRSAVRPERTLQSLYLEPLRQRANANNGRVYPGGPEVSLLIDLKDPWEQIYPPLRTVLAEYADIITSFRGNDQSTRAVRVILSGNRSNNMLDGEVIRYASLDGTLAELDSGLSAELVPWISSRWGASFSWTGEGEMPSEQRLKLRKFVAQAHQQGRRIRFWGAPDKLPFWQEVFAEKVDLINTDELKRLQSFLINSSE